MKHNSGWKEEPYATSPASSLLCSYKVNIRTAIFWDVTPRSLVQGTDVSEQHAKTTTHSANETEQAVSAARNLFISTESSS
jgi:hypothetical protein